MISIFDANAGFNQLPVKEEHQDFTTFRCHLGSFKFKRLPFGLRNGPPVFQRVMTKILSKRLSRGVDVYIDDIVVYGKDFPEHNRLMDWMLEQIEKSGITLSPEKCHIAHESLLLLGQKVSRLGMSTHKEKVEAIIDLDPPKNKQGLQTF